jgi:hypothetical protein
MHEPALRETLLIKAVEESDRDGMLIAPADRAAATRDASRAVALPDRPVRAAGALAEPAQRLLAERAARLRDRLVARFPVVDAVLALARGPRWIGGLSLALALLAGFALSALDGTRRINVLAFPLFGLGGWNLIVYAILLFRALRAGAPRTPSPLARLLARTAQRRAARLVAAAAKVDAPLGAALSRFAHEWFDAARPLLLARATRLFHLCAAAVGVGLIAGLYLRGVALDYRAGWESTLLDAPEVRRMLALAYGPASWLTGVPVPDEARLAAMRMTAGSGGESAAPWIHLLAATALLFIVLPRLALAFVASLTAWRRARSMAPPPSLVPYFRATMAAVDSAAGRGVIVVVPYACEPSAAATAALKRLLPEALGGGLAVDVRAPVRYGDEEAFLGRLADREASIADAIALLFSLASTPEDENHGSVIVGVRDFLARSARHAQLLLLIDEEPYAARMSAQGGYAARVDERRRVWRDFAAARGLSAGFVALDLAAPPEKPHRDAVAHLRAALWHAGTT